MSKYLLLLISCTFISFNSFGQTNVSGNVSGTWTKANSPYILTGDATVPGGQTLTIQPGVVVQSPSHFIDLRVEGTMLAQGTSADSIHFRGVATSSTSHGGTIFFLAGSSASVMDYVIVERMGDTNYEGAAIYISQGEIPTIQNTAIRFSEKDDFHVWVGGARKF